MREAREARCSPCPCAISCERLSKLTVANMFTLCSDHSLPLFLQPKFPVVMPKACHGRIVLFVVEIRSSAPIELAFVLPSHITFHNPHPGPLSVTPAARTTPV